jgi:hypothetical protein
MELLVYPPSNLPGNNCTILVHLPNPFPTPKPQANSGVIQKALLSQNPLPAFLPPHHLL